MSYTHSHVKDFLEFVQGVVQGAISILQEFYVTGSHTLDNVILKSHKSLSFLQRREFLIIEACILMPIVLALCMGRRTRKMNCQTYILSFAYWLIAAIEASDLLETALLSKDYKHVIFTTEAIVSIVMIIVNSYAIITLCSYITPLNNPLIEKRYSKKFDIIYKVFSGIAGVLFVEVPLLVARFQIMLTDAQKFLHGTFYMWILKDTLFICLIISTLVLQLRVQSWLKRNPCGPRFDNTDVFFQPEKRDTYIHYQRKNRCPSPVLTPALAKERFQSSTSSLSSGATNNSREDITRPIKPVPLKPQVQVVTKSAKSPPGEKKKKKVTFKLDVGFSSKAPRSRLREDEFYPNDSVV